MKKNPTETAKETCESELLKIERLLAVMTDELQAHREREASWPMAGTLMDTRKWLTDTLGILTGMDANEVNEFLAETDRNALAGNKAATIRRPSFTMVNGQGRRVRVTIPENA